MRLRHAEARVLDELRRRAAAGEPAPTNEDLSALVERDSGSTGYSLLRSLATLGFITIEAPHVDRRIIRAADGSWELKSHRVLLAEKAGLPPNAGFSHKKRKGPQTRFYNRCDPMPAPDVLAAAASQRAAEAERARQELQAIRARAAQVSVAPRARACCWPIGEPRDPGFRFCGDPTVPGRSYCGAHSATAYVAPRAPSQEAA